MSGLIPDVTSWVLVGLLTAAVALLLWAAVHPRSFRHGPLRRARSWWARIVDYGPAWPSLARRHGLAATDKVPDGRRPERGRTTSDKRPATSTGQRSSSSGSPGWSAIMGSTTSGFSYRPG